MLAKEKLWKPFTVLQPSNFSANKSINILLSCFTMKTKQVSVHAHTKNFFECTVKKKVVFNCSIHHSPK